MAYSRFKISYPLIAAYGIMAFIIVNILVSYMFVSNYKNHVINEIQINIREYDEVDLSHICQIADCVNIYNGKLYKNINHDVSSMARLSKCDDVIDISSAIYIMNGMYLLKGTDFVIMINISGKLDGYIVVPIENVIESVDNVYYLMLVAFLTMNIVFLIANYIIHKRDQFKRNIMLHHDGYNKSMMMLTENIHHELNTPLSVINSKVHKLKGKIGMIIDGTLTKDQCDADDSSNDFDIIVASLTQISDLLNRMRPFKDVKRQNDRCIHTVIRTSCDMMLVSQHEQFVYEIFSGLDDYRVDGKYLRNGELTAIMLNFIKNSVDANACNMQFRFNGYKDGIISIYIIDDGNGIPLHLQPDIFNENKSSKSSSRGTGLYVNKFILESAKGSLELKQSCDKGTVFEMKLRAIKV